MAYCNGFQVRWGNKTTQGRVRNLNSEEALHWNGWRKTQALVFYTTPQVIPSCRRVWELVAKIIPNHRSMSRAILFTVVSFIPRNMFQAPQWMSETTVLNLTDTIVHSYYRSPKPQHMICPFPFSQKTFIFSLNGSTPQLLFGICKLVA